jgi:hypothetical protein
MLHEHVPPNRLWYNVNKNVEQVINMSLPDRPMNSAWKVYMSNYLRMIPVWLLLWFLLDRYFDYTSSMFLFFKGWLLIYVVAAFITLNPLATLALTHYRLRKLPAKEKPSFLRPFLTVLTVSLLILFSPWIIAPVHTQINHKKDLEVISQLQKVMASEKGFDIRLINHRNQRDVFDSDWLSLKINLKVKNFEGHYDHEIESLLEEIEFKRDTVVDVIFENSNNIIYSTITFRFSAWKK